MKKISWVLTGLIFILFFQINKPIYSQSKGGSKVMEIKSSAFKNSEMIPAKYTFDGLNVSPPLSWDIVPKGAKSIALICDDPDAPAGTWVHWVIFNLPPNLSELPENIPSQKILPNGAKQGTNDFGEIGYGGPAPPSGTHRYYFKIYALDIMLNLKEGSNKQQLLKAMEGHILSKGELIGKYKR